MNITDYVIVLGVDARYRVRFETAVGIVTEFVIQLEYHAPTEWIPVTRYDNAHGFAHCDEYGPSGVVNQHQPMHMSDFGRAMNVAIQTIQDDWETLVAPFREARP